MTELADHVHFYKLGLELFMACSYFEMIKWLADPASNPLWTSSLFDVPQTVASAVRQLRGKGATFVTVHGNDNMLEAACEQKNGTKIFAVTVLTSLGEEDVRALGFDLNVKDLVLSRARRALRIGCDGVISSGLECRELRTELGQNFLIVVPGICPSRKRRRPSAHR